MESGKFTLEVSYKASRAEPRWELDHEAEKIAGKKPWGSGYNHRTQSSELYFEYATKEEAENASGRFQADRRKWFKVENLTLRPQFPVKFEFADDWFIFVTDQKGNWFSCNTELWGEWGYFSEKAPEEPNAVEKYMVSIMHEKQRKVKWEYHPEPCKPPRRI
jgi:hypothetical protein